MPAAVLAEEIGVSLRTVYRDVATLVAQGAPVEGEAGVGYVLRPGFFLPPLSFAEDEVDAVILGLRMVGARGDPALARAAEDALAKIVAVLPPDDADAETRSGLLAAPGADPSPHLAAIRQALRAERKVRLRYRDRRAAVTERTVWPVALGFFDGLEMLAAWCELRDGFRHFRLDRIVEAELTPAPLPRRRRLLLAEWRLTEEIDT